MNQVKDMTTKPDVRMLPIDDVIPTPDNPRTMPKPKDPAILEMAASMKKHGQLEAGIVRPHPAQKGKWDLRAGERRWVALQVAGIHYFEAKVLDLTDQEALEVTIVENMLREDLTPLEEARGCKTYLDQGWDIESTASALGKTEKWVRRRATLCELSPEWIKELEDPDSDFAGWGIGHLELVAKVHEKFQKEFLKSCKSYWAGAASMTVRDIRDDIAELLHSLAGCPWNMDDAELHKKAGACSACPKRSSQARPFLPALEPQEDGTEADECLDLKCYQTKLEEERGPGARHREEGVWQEGAGEVLWTWSGLRGPEEVPTGRLVL